MANHIVSCSDRWNNRLLYPVFSTKNPTYDVFGTTTTYMAMLLACDVCRYVSRFVRLSVHMIDSILGQTLAPPFFLWTPVSTRGSAPTTPRQKPAPLLCKRKQRLRYEIERCAATAFQGVQREDTCTDIAKQTQCELHHRRLL